MLKRHSKTDQCLLKKKEWFGVDPALTRSLSTEVGKPCDWMQKAVLGALRNNQSIEALWVAAVGVGEIH
jgi:hypothetical protein